MGQRASRPQLRSAPKDDSRWLVAQVHGGDILFSAEEIDQTVEDVCGVASRGARLYSPAEAEVDELGDDDIDSVIDQASIAPVEDSLNQLAKMATIMLNRPTMQQNIMQAFEQEPELRSMVEALSSSQGCGFGLLTCCQKPALPAPDQWVAGIAQEHRRQNFLQALMHEIGSGLEIAGEGLARAGQCVGSFLGRIGLWLRMLAGGNNASDFDYCEELGLSCVDRILGMTMCFALVVMAVLVAKRVGAISVLPRR